MTNEIHEVTEPDIEIVVKVGEREIAIFGIFSAGESEWDVVVGVDQADSRHAIQSALQLAIDAISSAHFSAIRTLGIESGEHPPFER